MSTEGIWRRGWVLTGLTLVVMVALEFHSSVPNVGNLGSLLETFLPWLGIAILPLGGAAVLRRSAPAAIATGALAVLWLAMFGTTLAPKGGSAGDFTVLTHNVYAQNTELTRTADQLLDADADVVALEELSDDAMRTFRSRFGPEYPYLATSGTVGLWSKFEITDSEPLDLGLAWARALRAVVRTQDGDLAVYAVHLASVRVGATGFTSDQRDRAIEQLADEVRADPVSRVIVMGDFNGSSYDRALAPLTEQLSSAQRVAGRGFGFSWPARFPMARIDQILARSLTPTRAWVLERTGSDHRPVAAAFED